MKKKCMFWKEGNCDSDYAKENIKCNGVNPSENCPHGDVCFYVSNPACK